jgi:hypothetical protein
MVRFLNIVPGFAAAFAVYRTPGWILVLFAFGSAGLRLAATLRLVVRPLETRLLFIVALVTAGCLGARIARKKAEGNDGSEREQRGKGRDLENVHDGTS